VTAANAGERTMSRQVASNAPVEPASPLVSYALQGLRGLWLPAQQRYAHSHPLDVAPPRRAPLPVPNVFYTLNVLLGLSRVRPADRPPDVDIERVYLSCCGELAMARETDRFPPYAYGMALWAGAALDIFPPPALVARILDRVVAEDRVMQMTAQDIAMLATGAVALALSEEAPWRALADRLVHIIQTEYFHPGARLFYNQQRGFRRSLASFASQVYPLLALYHYGAAFSAGAAIELANSGAAKVISLQGRRGEWGWFYYVPGGRLVDAYEIYAVHQHGMAPAFLHHAVAHGVPGARTSLVKGFNWLFGSNELGVSMLCPIEHMFYRSQLRQGELNTTAWRGIRSVTNALLHRSDGAERHRQLALRRECRSYELGWILWSFGGRSDYAELTQRPEFLV
jgi:hypothetical protein